MELILASFEEENKFNLMHFKKGKCKVALVSDNPMRHYTLRGDQLEGSCAEKDLGVMVNNELTVNQQSTLVTKRAKSLLDCIRKLLPADLGS